MENFLLYDWLLAGAFRPRSLNTYCSSPEEPAENLLWCVVPSNSFHFFTSQLLRLHQIFSKFSGMYREAKYRRKQGNLSLFFYLISPIYQLVYFWEHPFFGSQFSPLPTDIPCSPPPDVGYLLTSSMQAF